MGDDWQHLLMTSLLTFFTSTLVASAYWLAWSMVSLLSNPFTIPGNGDCYNTDALIGATERQLFATLRAQFDTTLSK